MSYTPDYPFTYYNRELKQFELKTVGEIALWWEYRRLKKYPTPNIALQELLRRHEHIFQSVAKGSHSKYSLTSEYEDKLQHCRYAAMRAYDKFNLNTATECGTKLSTYVQAVVYKYLQSAHDTDSFIDCPPTKRMIRSYLFGKFDGDLDRKSEIEQRLNIHSEQDREELRRQYCLLLPTYTSFQPAIDLEDEWWSKEEQFPANTPKDTDLITRAQLETHMKELSDRQRKVIEYFSQGYYMHEIADLLSVSEVIIRGDIRTIRVVMKREQAADNLSETLLLKTKD